MIKAILFDLDGVLVDACEWHYAALNRALERVAGMTIGRDEHETTFNGLPTSDKLSMLVSKNRITKDQVDDVWRLKQKYTVAVIEEKATIDPVKIDMLSQLRDMGMRVVCVTNSIRKTATLMLKKTGQYDMLGFIITNEDVFSPKPSSEGYNSAIKLLSIIPSEALIVEDSEKGLIAARGSGANILHVIDSSEVNFDVIQSEIKKHGWPV